MAGLVTEILKKIMLSVALIAVCTLLFNDLASFGESEFQSKIVFSFYAYCLIILLTASKNKLFQILSIPFLTQFIHIFQKFSFTAGANSIWRLLPFMFLSVYFSYFFLQNTIKLSPNQKLTLISWITLNSFYLFISPNLSSIAIGGILLYIILIPQYFIYLNFLSSASDFRPQIEKIFCLLFVILAFGTFALIYVAADYKGTDNLLATRNIADTNVTMAYFILLWPFCLLYAQRQRYSKLLIWALTMSFLALVVFSFSRGAVLIVLPYLMITVFLTKQIRIWLIPLALLVYLQSNLLIGLLENQDLAYFWSLRFGDIFSSGSSWDKLQSASGRIEIQNLAYELFIQKPLTGHGIGSFELLGPGFREAHSLYYTLLAEEGMIGLLYIYGLLAIVAGQLWKTAKIRRDNAVLILAFIFYLAFNHTVGSVFVIIPGKSISVNCIAPILLISLFCYAKSFQQYQTPTAG